MNSRKVSNGTPNLTERSVRTEHGMTYKPRGSWSQSLHSSRRSHDLPGRLGKPAVGRCALRGARDVPAGEWDNWSDVVHPASYLDPKGRGNNSMMRKGR